MKNTEPTTNKNLKPKIDYGSSLVPNFWLYLGIIAILSCLSFYGYRYWQLSHLTPQSDTQPSVNPSKSSSQIDSINSTRITKDKLSPEDLSIAADLDNIDVILQEMEQNTDRKNYIPLKTIPKKRKNELAPTKFTSKIQGDSDVKSIQTDVHQKAETPSLEREINNSSIQEVIDPSSTSKQIKLNSQRNLQIVNNNNLINSNNSDAEMSNKSLSSLGRIYNQNKNIQQQNSATNNSNTVNTPQTWQSRSSLEPQITSIKEPSINSGAVGNYGQLPSNLSDYQIQPQDYNLLVPSNYLALPRTNSQLTKIPNNGNSTQGTSTVPLNNLSSYQLQLQELNQFNFNNGLNTTNPANLSQPNNSSITGDRPMSNNYGLQPSGILQPSGLSPN